MFTTTAPQDFFKLTSDFFKTVPKTAEDTKELLDKIQAVFKDEYENSQDMWKIYQKAATGDATVNEIAEANKKAAELLKATKFATIMAFPGAVFFLPALVELAKTHGVDLVPASVAKQFDIK